MDPRPLIEALLNGIEAGAPADRLALGFHIAITRATTRVACEICAREGLDTVALSGGVFMNRLLLQLLTHELKDAGLAVLVPTPCPSTTAASPTVRPPSLALASRRQHRDRLFCQPARRRLTGVTRLLVTPASATIN